MDRDDVVLVYTGPVMFLVLCAYLRQTHQIILNAIGLFIIVLLLREFALATLLWWRWKCRTRKKRTISQGRKIQDWNIWDHNIMRGAIFQSRIFQPCIFDGPPIFWSCIFSRPVPIKGYTWLDLTRNRFSLRPSYQCVSSITCLLFECRRHRQLYYVATDGWPPPLVNVTTVPCDWRSNNRHADENWLWRRHVTDHVIHVTAGSKQTVKREGEGEEGFIKGSRI